VGYVPYVSLLLLGLSMLLSVVTNSLRRYTMLRLEKRFLDLNRPRDLEWFAAHEESLLLAASIWRILFNVGFVLLLVFYAQTLQGLLSRIVFATVSAVLLCIFGVALPMAWARYNSERMIVHMLPLLAGLRKVSLPALRVIDLLDVVVRRLSGVPDAGRQKTDLENELLSVVKEGEMEGAIEEQQKVLIESIIEFRDATVASVMVPRIEMICVSDDLSLPGARDFQTARGHSRIPVYKHNLDTVVGVLYARDLLAATAQPGFESKHVSDIMRGPQFIPETKRLTDLLHDFRKDKVHIAIVLDEYGGTAGLVTIEDIIEEIVGDIPDEHRKERTPGVQRLGSDVAEVDARTRVSDVNNELEVGLPEGEDYETVGGMVISRLGYIPSAGEKFEHDGLTITVLVADERRVSRLRIEGLDHEGSRRS